VFTVIHKDFFGQKEEIERKQFLSYDNIPTEIRQKVFFVISENAYHFENEGPMSYPDKVEDFGDLRYQISKYNEFLKSVMDMTKVQSMNGY
jgi:hypothetical protein